VGGLAALIFHEMVSERARRRATGRDDEERSSKAERERPLEETTAETTEISKLCFEYIKHFTTITTAAAWWNSRSTSSLASIKHPPFVV
jgi:hypothetical protein